MLTESIAQNSRRKERTVFLFKLCLDITQNKKNNYDEICVVESNKNYFIFITFCLIEIIMHR